MMNEKEKLRKNIDIEDAKIVAALVQRFKNTDDVGHYKKRITNESVKNKKREDEIMQTITQCLKSEDKESILKIYKTILDESKRRQQEIIERE